MKAVFGRLILLRQLRTHLHFLLRFAAKGCASVFLSRMELNP